MARKIPARIQGILNETRGELQNIYPDRFKDMILFGSYARGDFVNDSDIDIVLLLEHLNDHAAERERYLPQISRISLKYDTVVSIIPIDYQEFHTKRTPLILNVNKEGKRI